MKKRTRTRNCPRSRAMQLMRPFDSKPGRISEMTERYKTALRRTDTALLCVNLDCGFKTFRTARMQSALLTVSTEDGIRCGGYTVLHRAAPHQYTQMLLEANLEILSGGPVGPRMRKYGSFCPTRCALCVGLVIYTAMSIASTEDGIRCGGCMTGRPLTIQRHITSCIFIACIAHISSIDYMSSFISVIYLYIVYIRHIIVFHMLDNMRCLTYIHIRRHTQHYLHAHAGTVRHIYRVCHMDVEDIIDTITYHIHVEAMRHLRYIYIYTLADLPDTFLIHMQVDSDIFTQMLKILTMLLR